MTKASWIGLLAAAALVSGCGRKTDLVVPAGQPGPAVPAGLSAPPTPTDLTTPPTEARPERSDELLRRSEERRADPFALPPA